MFRFRALARRLAACACLALSPAVAPALDTTPPAALDRYRVSIRYQSSEILAIAAGPGSAEPLSLVRIANGRTGTVGSAYPRSDGSFDTLFAAQRGDRLTFTVRDQAGNISAATDIYVGAFRIKNPYRPAGQWHIGQVHTHTNQTDGANSPRDLEAAYYDAGYNFLISTDHKGPLPDFPFKGMTPDPDNSDRGKDLVWLSGTEVGTPDVHMGAWGNTQQINYELLSNTQTVIDHIRALGGIVVINHPEFSDPPKAWDWNSEILTFSGYSLVEAFNDGSIMVDPSGTNHLVDAVDLADSFRQVWWIGSDDCHDVLEPHWFDHFATILQTDTGEALDQSSIISAADAGRHYIRETANGPVISAIEVAGDEVTIRLADVASLYNVTWRRRGNEIAEQDLAVDQVARYTVRGSDGYIRAEVQRVSDGKRAYTQPLFIGNAADLAVAASQPELVDNNAATVWDVGSAEGIFVVDLGQARQVNGIQMDWDGADGRRFNYTIETSETGAFLGEQRRATRQTWSNRDALTVDFFDAYARYVRVFITGQSVGAPASARIREVEVFDSTPAMTHLYLDNVAGNDANDGLSGRPWRTFNYAKRLVRPRDVLHFNATGVSYPPLVQLGPFQSGLHPGARIQFTGDPVVLTEIDATGVSYGVRLSDTRYVDWRHFRIHGATTANVRLQGAQVGTVLQNNRLHGGLARGIDATGEFTAAYNVIDSNASEGIFVSGAGTRATLFNNVIYGNGRDGVSVHTTGDVRANVWNNIIDANALVALRRGTNGQVTDGYNCVRGSLAGAWQQVGNVTADPLLVAPASGDFSLQATSPCIDAGLDLDQVSDFAGNPIVDMPLVPNTGNVGQHLRTWLDIGAHEQQVPCCPDGGGCHRAMRD